MADLNETPIEQLSPFKKFCCSIGYLPTSFQVSMTYEEQLVWLVQFLQKNVIPTVNNNGKAVAELQEYVEHYFDNLDVQQEINNKLDSMAESGELEEIIAEYINSNALICFDTVTDLKAATNLVNGSYAQTLGYHSKNDNGNAKYKIRTITNDDVVNEMTIIALSDNTLIAELIVDSPINVKKLGAYGDNTHDDTTPIQYAVSNYKEISIPYGQYKITNPIEMIGREMSIYGEEAIINYTGSDYALDIKSLVNSTIKIGNINADNGECIYIHSDYNDFNTTYLNIHCKYLSANENKACIHGEINSSEGYCNEIHFYDGRFRQGKYGLLLETNDNNDIDGWRFNNIDIEGVDVGFKLDAGTSNKAIRDFQIVGARTDELDYLNAKLIETIGYISGLLVLTSSILKASYFNLSANTTNSEIFGTIRINNVYSTSARIKDGKIYGAVNTYPMLDSETSEVSSGDDLNDYLQTGTYTLSESVTTSVTNAPNDSLSNASKLIVMNITTENSPTTANYLRIIQIFINRSNMYYRYITNDSGTFNYRTWKKITTTEIS